MDTGYNASTWEFIYAFDSLITCMNLKINIKNIGKLVDAGVHIANFTVFAGPNNTGKSFVSKLLYSLFDAMNTNHAQIHINNLIDPVVSEFYKLVRWTNSDIKTSESSLEEDGIEKLETLVNDCSISNSEELDEVIRKLLNQTDEIQKRVEVLRLSERVGKNKRKKQDGAFRAARTNESINELKKSLTELTTQLKQTSLEECIIAGMEYKIRQNLIYNFQIPNLSDLRGEEKVPSGLNVEELGKFEFSNGEIGFEVDHVWLQELQHHSNVIYLESPIYWKLKEALEDVKRNMRFFRRRKRELLSGVPEYFYDLIIALKFQRTGDIAFPDLYEKLTGEDVMGGKLAISESGDLSFLENGRSFSLPVTAMGIINLGILALLIERKVLDEGSFIFIDEPEAHLHPAWQIIMAETLFELSRQGVNVVIATHSVDILKWLEVHIKKTPDDKRLVALNKFPINRTEVDEDFETKIASIKQELTKPFSDLYLEGV